MPRRKKSQHTKKQNTIRKKNNKTKDAKNIKVVKLFLVEKQFPLSTLLLL